MGRSKLQDVTTILFDLDNTLIDTKGADRIACEEVSHVLQNYGVNRKIADQIVDQFYASIRERPQGEPLKPNGVDVDVDAWRTMLWKEALGPKLANIAPTVYDLWKTERMKYVCFSAEIENLLVVLRKHFKLGLITNGPSSAQWEKINKVNGLTFFDAVVVSGDVHKEKPSPAIFDEIFRRLDVSSLECVMVGDKLETDIKGAIRARCAATVWVSSQGGSLESVQPQPDFQIEHVRDLPDLFPERNIFPTLYNAKSLGFFHSLRDETVTWKKKTEW